MKAIQIKEYGDSSILQVVDLEKPQVKSGQILVENHAASINPFDVKLSQGMFKNMIPLNFPVVLGGDFAGVVAEVGEGVQNLAVGDEVYGQAIVLNGGSGTFAEYLNSTTANAAKKPTSISFDEAAALPLVGVSALQALEDEIKLSSNQKILIHGGAGGIGHIAVQLAKALGAHVATTVSSPDVDFAKSLGADEVIDYKTQKFDEILKDYDAVFDAVVSEDTVKSSASVLKNGSTYVSMLPVQDKSVFENKQIKVVEQQTKTTTDRLARLAKHVDEGKIKVNIDSVYPLDQAKEAFDKQNQHPKGKVVFHIK